MQVYLSENEQCLGLMFRFQLHVNVFDWPNMLTFVLFLEQVSDKGLASLALLENLECLSLISCNNVTDMGLNCLRSGCKSLQVLQSFVHPHAEFSICCLV